RASTSRARSSGCASRCRTLSSHLPIVIVVSGPSGAGKSTILQRALVEIPHLRFSVSHTTRPPRPGEREGIDYHFVTRDEFLRLAVAEKFLESAEVHGQCYGTARAEYARAAEDRSDLLLDLDASVESLKAIIRAARCRTSRIEPAARKILSTFDPGK